MTFEEAKRVSVYDLCIKFGAKRVQASDAKHYALFHAPYREDRHPSLVVDLSANRWRDLAKGYGGDAVDLVCRQYEYMSARDALAFLGGNHMERSVDSSYSYKKMSPLKKENKNGIDQIPLIAPLENPVLLDYVASRAVAPAIAKRYCKEAHKVSSSGKPYYTLAFPSLSDGYELRNAGFKGAEGPKDISVIGDGNVFLFFEGFFDFLSYLQIFGKYEKDYADACRLFIEERNRFFGELQTIPYLRVIPSQANYFLCEVTGTYTATELTSLLLKRYNILIKDPAGRAATDILMKAFPYALDFSYVYAETKDLNDFHQLYRYSHKLKDLTI